MLAASPHRRPSTAIQCRPLHGCRGHQCGLSHHALHASQRQQYTGRFPPPPSWSEFPTNAAQSPSLNITSTAPEQGGHNIPDYGKLFTCNESQSPSDFGLVVHQYLEEFQAAEERRANIERSPLYVYGNNLYCTETKSPAGFDRIVLQNLEEIRAAEAAERAGWLPADVPALTTQDAVSSTKLQVPPSTTSYPAKVTTQWSFFRAALEYDVNVDLGKILLWIVGLYVAWAQFRIRRIARNNRRDGRRETQRLPVHAHSGFLGPYIHHWKRGFVRWLMKDLGPEVIDTVTPQIVATVTPQIVGTITPQIVATITPQIIATIAPQIVDPITPQMVDTITPQILEAITPRIMEALKLGQFVDEILLAVLPLLDNGDASALDRLSVGALKQELKPFIESIIVSFAKGKAKEQVPKIEGEPTGDIWTGAFDLRNILGDSLLSALPEDVTAIAENRMGTLEAFLRKDIESIKERLESMEANADARADDISILRNQVAEILEHGGFAVRRR